MYVNKEKMSKWVRNHLDDIFDDVIWTDETNVQLEAHRRFCNLGFTSVSKYMKILMLDF